MAALSHARPEPSPGSKAPFGEPNRKHPKSPLGVLRSRAALTIVAFWLFLGVAYFTPGPVRELLRREDSPVSKATSAVPTVARPRAKAAPRLPGSAKRAGAGAAVAGQRIEDRKSSLTHFARALASLRRGKRQRVRVLHYGDSQIDIDHITGALRQRYQKRYGNAGLGYVPVAKPWRWFYQPGVHHKRSDGWRLHRLAGGKVPDGRLGLGLSASERRSGKAWIQVVRMSKASLHPTSVELTYLRQPGGGGLVLHAKGRPVQRAVSSSAGFGLGVLRVEGLSGPSQVVRISTRGKVRLFGLRFERPKGLTWEGLPMISARFYQLSLVDHQLWRAQLQQSDAALVVYQFGANDALSYGGDLGRYEAKVRGALKLRGEALPKGSCLVVGPLDQLRRRGGKLEPLPTVTRVIGAQRRAARAAGCAFWDARAAMGGPGSLKAWIAAGLLRRDMVHLNRKGARKLAGLLDDALQSAMGRSPAGAKTPSEASSGRP